MARQILHKLIDDIDGTELPVGGGEPITFGVDGATYEIDLSDENAKALRAAIAPYLNAARRTASTRAIRRRGTAPNLEEVRAWARENDFAVSARGRVPVAVLAAYHAR